jgi:hypothetical protein
VPALAVRRHHHAAREQRGVRVSVVLAGEMQAQVDARARTSARRDVAVIDVEPVRLHSDLRELLLQLRGATRMRGGGASVQQSCARECENAGADRNQPGPTRVRVQQRAPDGVGQRVLNGQPAGDDHGVSGLER